MLGAGLVRDAGTAAQKDEILPGVASGELRLALAHYEPGGRFDIDRVATTATRSGNGFLLKGTKAVVLGGESADKLIVSAGSPASLFLVDARAQGLTVTGYRTRDSHRAADVALDGVVV